MTHTTHTKPHTRDALHHSDHGVCPLLLLRGADRPPRGPVARRGGGDAAVVGRCVFYVFVLGLLGRVGSWHLHTRALHLIINTTGMFALGPIPALAPHIQGRQAASALIVTTLGVRIIRTCVWVCVCVCRRRRPVRPSVGRSPLWDRAIGPTQPAEPPPPSRPSHHPNRPSTYTTHNPPPRPLKKQVLGCLETFIFLPFIPCFHHRFRARLGWRARETEDAVAAIWTTVFAMGQSVGAFCFFVFFLSLCVCMYLV